MIRRLILTAVFAAVLITGANACSHQSETSEVQAQAVSAAAAAKEGLPAVIDAFHIYSTEMDSPGAGQFFVEWTSFSEEKTIESIYLSVTGDFAERTGEDADQNPGEITFRFMVPDGAKPGDHSVHTEKFDGFAEDTEYTAEITRICFTDGRILEGERLSNSVTAAMWGSRGEGEFPARLNEASFWRESEGATKVDFQADWTNLSENTEIRGVIYRIAAFLPDGSPVTSENGEEAVLYYSSWEDIPVLPGQRNQNGGGRLYEYDHSWLQGSSIFEISIARVIDRTGTVWDAPEGKRTASCILTGRKGYVFEDIEGYPAVRTFVQNLAESFSKNSLNYDNPDVFIREHEYCVLCYPDLDIRVELTAENEISPDKVSFIWYGSFPDPEGVDIILGKIRLAVYPVVLAEIDPAEAVEKITAFNTNQRSYIDFTDQRYDTFEDGGRILDAYGYPVLMMVEAAGKDLYYPSDFFLWAKGYPYERSYEPSVSHRPSWDVDYSVIQTAEGKLPELPEMWFSSGAGAWGTMLDIQPDGTFTGNYESSYWETEDKHIRNHCTFSGAFTDIQRRDDYSFTMKLDHIQYEKEPGEEAEEEGGIVHYTKPAGIEEGDQEFVLYLPGAEIAGMSDGFLSWVWGDTGILTDDVPDRQPFYSLHNLSQDTGFKGWPE